MTWRKKQNLGTSWFLEIPHEVENKHQTTAPYERKLQSFHSNEKKLQMGTQQKHYPSQKPALPNQMNLRNDEEPKHIRVISKKGGG